MSETSGPAKKSALPCVLMAENEVQTQAIAAALAQQCRRGDCILLRGDLGAGKTTFARGFIQALSPAHEEVVSPTFTLVQIYPAGGGEIVWHFDLYRLRNEGEAEEIGLDEALNEGISLIEWPEMIESRLPEEALDVTIEIIGTASQRRFTFTGASNAWQARLDGLKNL